MSNDSADIGVLHVDMDSVFLINDGQHRKAAIEAAMQEDESLGKETISIVFSVTTAWSVASKCLQTLISTL